MKNKDLSNAIWLPLQPDELNFLQATLRSADVLVAGNYACDDPYVLIDYLVAATVDDCEFFSLFDRNLISPMVALARGENVPESSQAQCNTRLAAACACFCILAKIYIEPNISLYEFAATSGNEAAQSDAHLFRVADNSDAIAYLDIALGRARRLPRKLLEHVHTLPEVADHHIPEKNFERSLKMWKPNYLYALKTVALRRSGLSPFDAAMALIHWQAEEAFFAAPAGMYCIAAIAHAPPKGGMLKSLLSKNLTSLKSGLRNATWDICLLQQFGRLMRQPEGPKWSLWSTDIALKEIARSLFVRDDEIAEDKLTGFFERHWGPKDGRHLVAAYMEALAVARQDGKARKFRMQEVLSKLDERVKDLEGNLGFSDV